MTAEIRTNWAALSASERESVVDQIRSADYPDAEAWMTDELAAHGLQSAEWLYRDEFYGTLRFEH